MEGWWGGSAGKSGGLPLRMFNHENLSSIPETHMVEEKLASCPLPANLHLSTVVSVCAHTSCPLPANLHLSMVVSVHTQPALCPPHECGGVGAHKSCIVPSNLHMSVVVSVHTHEWMNEFPYKWVLRWKAGPELSRLARWNHKVPRKNRWDCEQTPCTASPSPAPSPLSLNSSPSTLISWILYFIKN